MNIGRMKLVLEIAMLNQIHRLNLQGLWESYRLKL